MFLVNFVQETSEAPKPKFRLKNKETGELLWASSDRGKQVAENVKRSKDKGYFGPQLLGENVSYR